MAQRNCKSIRPLISAFLDGGLSAAETAELQSHLETCEDCARVMDEYRTMRYMLDRAPDVPPPPPELRRAIYAKTVDQPPPSRAARWFGFTSLKWGTSTVAAFAVLLIVSAFLLVQGYDRTLTPIVNESAPAASQEWPVFRPIEIQFNKAMNHESVLSNLLIQPRGEQDRLPTSWRGETLIIGANESESAVLLSDTDYLIMISRDAEDAWGNRLGVTWTLAFHTAPIDIAVASPTPTPVITAAITQTPTEDATEQTPSETVVPSESSSRDQPTTTPMPSPTQEATSTEQPKPDRQQPARGSLATPPTAPSSPSGTQEPSATSTPSPTPTQPVATPVPSPTPTAVPATPAPTPAATPIPTQTPPPTTALQPTPSATTTAPVSASPTAVPVIGAFGSVYWAEAAVQSSLGAPLDAEYSVNAAELGFQHGTMYERFDTGVIYALLSDGTVVSSIDTWTSADGDGGGPGPEENLWIPKRGFGQVWNSNAELSSSIGYAVSSDDHYFEGRVQEFQNGLMLYSDQGFIYVLYSDGTWQLFPDTSGRGNTITPTPIPSVEPTPTPSETATEVPTTTPDQSDAVTPEPELDTQSDSGDVPLDPQSSATETSDGELAP